VAEEKGCSSVLFFEARKRQDLYLWMVSSTGGSGQHGSSMQLCLWSAEAQQQHLDALRHKHQQ
jgi:hypothetical protein